MKVQHPIFNNCIMAFIYLYLRGLAREVILCKGGNWFVPWHLLAVNKKGNVIHFQSLRRHRDNRWGAWWHEGTWQVISPHSLESELKRQKRVVLCRRSPHWVALRCIMAWMISLPFYMLTFGMFPLINAFHDSSDAVLRRMNDFRHRSRLE